MFKTWLVLLFLFSLLLNNGWTSELKAVQMLFSPVNHVSKLNSFFRKAQDTGINTIIIRLFSLPGDRDFWRRKKHDNFSGVYFKTKFAPYRDIYLDKIIKSAHKYGIKVFGWMTTRKCVWALDSNPKWADIYYDIDDKKFKYRVDRLDLFNPKVCSYLSKLISDIPKAGLDGLLFQDDFVIRYNEGFTESAINGFYKFDSSVKGINPHNFFKDIEYSRKDKRNYVIKFTDNYLKWQKWKNLYIINVLNNFIISMKKYNSNFKTVYNCYYETVIMPDKAKKWLSQDLISLQKYSVSDFLSVMFYHIQMSRELHKSFSNIKKMVETGIKNNIQSSKVVIKLQLKDWKTRKTETISRLKSIVELLKKYNLYNFIIVPVDDIKDMKIVKGLVNLYNAEG